MSAYPIRPHHLLCLCFFEGNGYSPAFVENMTGILKRLEQDAWIKLVPGEDIVCAACPHNSHGVCLSQDKVSRYDKAVLTALHKMAGDEADWKELQNIVFHNLIQSKRFLTICKNCEWIDICTQKANTLLKSR